MRRTQLPLGKHHQSSHHGRTAKPKPNHKYHDPSILQHSAGEECLTMSMELLIW